MKKLNRKIEDIINLCLVVPSECSIVLIEHDLHEESEQVELSLNEVGENENKYLYLEIKFLKDEIILTNCFMKDPIEDGEEDNANKHKKIKSIIANIMKQSNAVQCYTNFEGELDIDEGVFELKASYDEILNNLKTAFGTRECIGKVALL